MKPTSSAAWIAGLLIALLPAVPAMAGRHLETDHFMVYCRERDYSSGTITDAQLARWGQWLEASYTKLVGGGGLNFRLPSHPIAADPKIKILVHPFAESDRYQVYGNNPGFAVKATGRIHLNQPIYLDAARADANRCTIGHELFHLIQFSYDEREEPWLMEAPARWAPGAIFPEIDQSRYCISAERVFLEKSFLPLSFDFVTDGGRRIAARRAFGHPYGASLFFRFLTRQTNDPAAIRRTWESAAGMAGPNALEAIAKALGGVRPLDPAFRQIYDRFAIGCAMNDKAPADCLLPDVAKLSRGATKVVPPRTNLFAPWLEHCRNQRDPKAFAPFAPTFEPAPDLALVAQGVFPPRAGAGLRGWVAGRGGIRCMLLPKPPSAAADGELEISVAAGADDLSLQGVARYNGNELKVFHATFANGKHTLKIPDLPHCSPNILLVLTGYADSIAAVNYPMSIAMVDAADGVRIDWRGLERGCNSFVVTAPAAFKIPIFGGPGNPPYRGYEYTLYWATDQNGPFTAIASPLKAGQRHWDHDASNKNNKMPASQFVMSDGYVTSREAAPHKPLYYQIGQRPVLWDAQDKATPQGPEVRSNVLAPSRKAIIRIDGLPDDAPEVKALGGFGQFTVAMALQEQQFQYWNAHITVEGGGAVQHYWTPRREGDRSFGSTSQSTAYVRLFVPRFMPQEVTISAECDGLTATRKVKVLPAESWAQADAQRILAIEKEIAAKEQYYATSSGQKQKRVNDIAEDLKKGWPDPRDSAIFTAQESGTKGMYERDIHLALQCELPTQRNVLLAEMALLKRDLKKPVELMAQNVALENKRFEIEVTYQNQLAEIYRTALASKAITASDRKRFEDSLADLPKYRAIVQKEHKLRLYAANGELMKMAATVSDPASYKSALQVLLADEEHFIDGMYASNCPEETARTTGDRALAADLQRRIFKSQLDKANPAARAEMQKNQGNSILQYPWWPVGQVPTTAP